MQRIINKEQWNKSGIYKITNLINKNFYIGSTKNIGSRYRTHVYTLKNNKSNCTIFQNAINKYGINNYVICLSLFVLIICGGISLKNSLRKQKELNR